MNLIIRLIDRISGGMGLLAAWVLMPLIFATVFEVISRYVFNSPTMWAYEIGYMATGANFLLGVAYTLREGGHIRIDVLHAQFRPRTKAIVDFFGYLILFLPAGLWLSYRLGLYAMEAIESGEGSGESAWNPVIWPFRIIFFLGIAMLTLQAIAECVRAFKAMTKPSSDVDTKSHG